MKAIGTLATSFQLQSRVLGAALSNPDVLHELPAGFSSRAFEHETLRRAFDALVRLTRRASFKAVNPEALDHLILAEAGLSDSDRGVFDIARMDAEWARGIPIRDLALALLDKQRRNDLANALQQAQKDLLEGEEPTEEIVGRLTTKLLDLDQSEQPETVSFRDAALTLFDVMDKAKVGGQHVVQTGFPDLDRKFKMRRGNLVVLAARTGVGKTTLALNIADNCALRHEYVLVHSLEMDDTENVSIALSRASGMDTTRFFDESPLTTDDYDRLSREIDRRCMDARGLLTGGWLMLNTHYPSLGAICRISEKTHRRLLAEDRPRSAEEKREPRGLSLIVVDYMQLVALDLGKNASREQVVATIARTLKRLAARLGVPVLALAQLSREVEKRGEQKPRGKQVEEDPRTAPPKLHDLRESGAIEQDANGVWLLHNPYAQSPNTEQREHGPYQLHIAKQRLGQRDVSVYLRADMRFARFLPYSPTGGPE